MKNKLLIIFFLNLLVSILFVTVPSKAVPTKETTLAATTTAQDYYTETLSYGDAVWVWFADLVESGDSIYWVFAGSNQYVGITVRAMDENNLELFKEYKSYTAETLSDGGYIRDSGMFTIPYTDVWYFVFSNEDPIQETTTINYDISFSPITVPYPPTTTTIPTPPPTPVTTQEPSGRVTREDGNIKYEQDWTTPEYESVLLVQLLTNERWETGKWYTLILCVEAATFGAKSSAEYVDRFHEISGEIRMTHNEREIYYSDEVQFYDIGSEGDPREEWLYAGFSDTELGLQVGEEASITVWYRIHFKEGVVGWFDPDLLSIPWAQTFTLVIESKEPYFVPGKTETHTLHLDHSLESQYTMTKSQSIPTTDYTITFGITFRTVWEIADTTVLKTTMLPETSSTDLFELALELVEDESELSFGFHAELGLTVTTSEDTWEVTMPMPTVSDVDGDGSAIDMPGLGTIYLWDNLAWITDLINDRYGDLIYTTDIEVDIAKINILKYVTAVVGTPIPDWLGQLYLKFDLGIQSLLLEQLWFDVTGTELTPSASESAILGYIDWDSTEDPLIDTVTFMTAQVSGRAPQAEIRFTPNIAAGVYYRFDGTISAGLEIAGIDLGSVPLLTLAYHEKIKMFEHTFQEKKIWRTLVYTTFEPETTSLVPEFCLNVVIYVLAVSVMAFLRKVKRPKAKKNT